VARTTFRLDAELLAEAKAFAAKRHCTLNSVMEDALRQMLSSARARHGQRPVDLVTWDGRLVADVDLSPHGIAEILERDEAEHFLEVASDDAPGH
jgi:hypothetical protein